MSSDFAFWLRANTFAPERFRPGGGACASETPWILCLGSVLRCETDKEIGMNGALRPNR